jgi:hypothetical protein
MPDEIIVDKPIEQTPTFDSFDGKEKPTEEKKTEPIVDEKKTDEKPIIDEKPDAPPEVKVFDENLWVKEKFGWDNAEKGKEELTQLRQRASELDLTDEDSRKVLGYIKGGKTKELYQFLHLQEQIEKLVTADVSDKSTATELVKFGISNKNKTLTQDEVDFLFNERFSKPEQPIQNDSEEDEDYNKRVDAWKAQVANIEKRLVIEAKLSQPELQKLKSELKLPDIVKTEAAPKELSPEELANIQKGRELFLQDADAELKKFEGFTAAYKDKDVDVQSSYKLSDDENKNVLNQIKKFSEKGFDANAIFGERWVKGGKFDFIQMAKDLAAIETDEKRSQKYLSDASSQAKIQYIKTKHQIDLGGNRGGDLQLEDKELQKKKEDAIWN